MCVCERVYVPQHSNVTMSLWPEDSVSETLWVLRTESRQSGLEVNFHLLSHLADFKFKSSILKHENVIKYRK